MKILVLSDLHLGTGDNFGTFGWSDDDFIATLKQVILSENIDQVILNGDVYELYKYSFKDIIKKHKKLISFFKENNFVYIRGNHDYINCSGKFFYDITNSKKQKIHIEHGHDCDFLNGTTLGRVFGRVIFKILKQLVKNKSLAKIYHKVVEFDDQINRIPRKYDSYKYLKYALHLLKTYDVVILSHTHKLDAHKTYYLSNKKLYLNTGSCSHRRFQAITLDTETLFYDTIKIGSTDRQSR